jgi:hypothetical protein
MKITAKMAILALLVMPCHPEGRQDKQLVTVYVDSRAELSAETLATAELLASRMFEAVGVSLRWRRGQPKVHDTEQKHYCWVHLEHTSEVSPGRISLRRSLRRPT